MIPVFDCHDEAYLSLASNPDRRLVDPDRLFDHVRRASLYRRAGDAGAARPHQRIAEAGGVAVEERA